MVEDERSVPEYRVAALSFGDNIEVLVGIEQRRFTVHRNIICNRSEFFKAACSKKWTELREPKAIELPNDIPEIFDFYLWAVYRNEIHVGDPSTPIHGEDTMEDKEHYRRYHRMVRVYVLADKLMDIPSLNLVIDAMVDYSDSIAKMPPVPAVRLALAVTSQNSPLQRLLVDHYVHESAYHHIEALVKDESTPASFVARILLEKGKA